MSIAAIDQKLRAVETFAAAVDHHTTTLNVTVARERNRMLPIHRLPSEIFTHILLQTRETSKDLDTRSVIRWTAICSIWRQIIIGTPTLWRRLDLDDGDILDLAISRNASIPLELHWRDRDLSTDGTYLSAYLYRMQSFIVWDLVVATYIYDPKPGAL